MEKITFQQFLVRQPSFPEETPTDRYYFDVANRLYTEAIEGNYFPGIDSQIIRRTSLCLTGYLQDVVSDGGIWRTFIDENRRLYGRTLPFFKEEDDYVDYELNDVDVRFMTWYAMAMSSEAMRFAYPLDPVIASGASRWADTLQRIYEEAPVAEGFRMWHELDIRDQEDAQQIYRLGSWLFMHCYLMTPAFSQSLTEIMSDPQLRSPENFTMLQQRLEQSMMEDPTGPLALFTREWIYLITEGKMPPAPDAGADRDEHPYYTSFVKATGGETIAFFSSYEDLNRFFVEALGWEKGESHLPQVKDSHDFILMVDRHKGMLLAKDIARCVAAPGNPLYDRTYARDHAIDLLTVRGVCPADLLHRIGREGWLPDARFRQTDDCALVADNFDFIARCYLQQYYRGD